MQNASERYLIKKKKEQQIQAEEKQNDLKFIGLKREISPYKKQKINISNK